MIIFTVKSFVELVRYLLSIPGVTSFLSEKLSQDPLEKYFGCQRQRGGTNENPTVQQFCKNSQALRVVNSVCGHIPRGNCRGRKESIDWEQENRPLPKRRKVQLPFIEHASSSNQGKLSKKIPQAVMSLKAETKPLTEEQSDNKEVEEVSCHRDDLVPDKTLSSDGKQKSLSYTKDNSCVDSEMPPTVNPFCTSQMNLAHSSFQEQKIDQALGHGPADEILSTGYHICLKRCDFQLLSNGKWLNDKVSSFVSLTLFN